MRGRLPVLVLLAAATGCGARTGLDLGAEDGGAEDGAPGRRGCRDQPNCIEATLEAPSGEVVDFARTGEVTIATAMGRGAWLETDEAGGLGMAVQVDLVASPGAVELSLNPSAFYVDVRLPEASCNVRGAGVLERVDLRPGGVTEGTFAGRTQDSCGDGAHDVRDGWFRLTAP